MIPRKRLQLLLYMLHIIYVLGEDGPSDLEVTPEVYSTISPPVYYEDSSEGNDFEKETTVRAITEFDYGGTEAWTVDNDFYGGTSVEFDDKSTEAQMANGSATTASPDPGDESVTKSFETKNPARDLSLNLLPDDCYDDYTSDYTKDDESYETTTVNSVEFTTEADRVDYETENEDDRSDQDRSIENTTESIFEKDSFTPSEPSWTSDDAENEIVTCDFSWMNRTEELKNVENLTVTFIGTEWISLSWDPPCKNLTDRPVYSIDVCTSDDRCTPAYEKNTEHNATGLTPCTQYTFVVKLIMNGLTSSGVNVSSATSDNVAEVGVVRHLTVHYVMTDMLRLIWDKPAIYPTCVRNYTVTQCLVENCNTTTVTSTEYRAQNLRPCAEYYFTVVAVTDTVKSAAEKVSAKTRSPKLSEPQYIEAEPGSFSMEVSWQPPKVGASCIKHYNVTVNSNIFTQTTTSTNITISGLYACTAYEVSVHAVNEDDENGIPATVTKETSPIVTKPPQIYDPEPVVSADSVIFTWNIEKENNNCVLLSLVTVCNYTTSNGRGFDLVDGEGISRIDSRILGEFLLVNTTVNKISPYTSYTCSAYTINKAGYSDYSEVINVTTLEDVPSPPILRIEDIKDSRFTLTWDPPEYLAGNLEDFEITLSWKTLYPIPDWCSSHPTDDFIRVNNSVLSYEYSNVTAYTNYVVRIRAKTTVGWGNYCEPVEFQSKPRVPGMVSKLSHRIQERQNDTNILDTTLTWSLPCFLNGMLEYFNVSVYGDRKGFDPHTFTMRKYVTSYIYKNDMFSVTLENLRGEYNYTFTISSKVEDVDDYGLPATHSNVLFPAGIPPQPEEEYIRSITIDPYKARRSTSSASILLPLFPNTNGEIIYYSIIISELGYNPASNTRFDLRANEWPNISSWEEAMLRDFTIPYQATKPQWDPYPNFVADYGHMKVVKYVLGEDTACKEISPNINKRLYCNGPLKPDTWYDVRMRAFTYGGYTDSPVFVVKTNAEINVAVVIGIVFGILFLGILTTMMLLVRKCSPLVAIRRFLHSDMPGSPVPAPFTRKKFIAHCQQLVDNPGKLSNEFRLLQTLSVDLQMPTNTACLQANRKKNRYSDILPYDFSRVKLEVIDNDPNTDYINASFIRGYTGEDEYIACQGPKEETTYDFWRMVDQYNVNIVVMLTQLIEKGKEKCHQYFPTISETFRYESMTIRCSSELDFRTYTQRTLVLQKGNKKRSIIHLHFKDWPDHDVPEDFDTMINFCQIMRRNILANKGYAVIHCSAGIGRTGTLITIDILLQHLRDNRKLDVFGTVYRLRHHRINMVQRESQYAYIYNCIKQVLKNPYCLKTYKPPPVDPVFENTLKKMKATSNSNANLVNTLETLKKRNFFMSMDSIGPLYNILSWTNKKPQDSTAINGLRYSKSTSAIDAKTFQLSTEESDSADCLIYEVLNKMNKEFSRNGANKDPVTESTSLV